MIPAWLTGKTVTSDRVLTAAWFAGQGYHTRSNEMLHSVTSGLHDDTAHRTLRTIADLIAEHMDLEARLDMLTHGDLTHYVDTYEDDRPRGDWPGWREDEMQRLIDQHGQIVADMRVLAETVAQYADWSTAA